MSTNTNTIDWKDVANSQFDKALTLALLIVLFGIMVTPKVDIKKQTFKSQEMQAVELPPEERERLKPPEDVVKPVVDIVISDELSGSDATDPDMLADIQRQLGGDIFSKGDNNLSGGSDKPFDFVPYEDAPEPINPVAPAYTDFAAKAGVEGLVYLEVNVYKDGSIGEVTVKKSLQSGPGGLDEAAVNAVKKWKFQPGKSGGKPIDTSVIIPIEFSLTQ